MKVTVNKSCATVSGAEMLTSGMIGKTIDVEYSPDWDGLIKTAVFSNGMTQRDNLYPVGTIEIPWEVLELPNKHITVGFYGYRMEGNEKVYAIPTIYAELGVVRTGADPSGDPSNPPTPEVSEQILAMIGDLDGLDTQAKENLVAAINEANSHGGGGGSASSWNDITGKPFITVGDNLKVINGALTVDTASNVQQDNTKPITSAAVYAEVGNINALLALI